MHKITNNKNKSIVSKTVSELMIREEEALKKDLEYWKNLYEQHKKTHMLDQIQEIKKKIEYNEKWEGTRWVFFEGVFTFERLYYAMRQDRIRQKRSKKNGGN